MARNSSLYLLYRVLTVEGLTYGLYLPWLLTVHSLAPATVALLMAAYDFTLLSLQVPTGQVADRCGRKVSLAIGSLSQIAGTILFWQANTLPLILLALVTIATGDAFRCGAQEALLFESCRDFGPVYARSQVVLLGVLAGLTAIGGLIGYRWAFGLETLCAILGLAVVGFFIEPALAEKPPPVPMRQLLNVCPWQIVLASALTMVCTNAAGFALRMGLVARGPATVAFATAILPLVEMWGASLALKTRVTLRGWSLYAAGGLMVSAFCPAAAVVPYFAAGAAPALKLIALNRVAEDSYRASLDSLAGAVELVVGCLLRLAVARSFSGGSAAAGVALLGLTMLAAALSIRPEKGLCPD